MSTTSGAWVRRARLAAAEGMPMPTKHTVPFFRRRAASIVMISVGAYCRFVPSGIGDFPLARRDDARRFHEFHMVLRAQHVLLHPGGEALAVLRDAVPRLAEGVVAPVVAVGVARMRAVGHHAYGREHPVGQQARVHRRVEL